MVHKVADLYFRDQCEYPMFTSRFVQPNELIHELEEVM